MKPGDKRKKAIKYSVIIPVYKEQNSIRKAIKALKIAVGIKDLETIIVDGDPGGSTINEIDDDSIIKLISDRGRARQMNKGAAAASGDVLIFLHADTRLPIYAFNRIKEVIGMGYPGGAFKLQLDSRNILIRIISFTANLRVFLTGSPYGDQAIFIKKSVYKAVGGFPDIFLMEDVALVKKIKKEIGELYIVKEPVVSSARKWINNGIMRTTLKNHISRLLYFLKVSPEKIERFYYRK